MIKGQIGYPIAIVAILVTLGGFMLVRSDGNQKGEEQARHAAEQGYHAVRTVLRLDGQAARAVAREYAVKSAAYFSAIKDYQQVAAAEVARAVSQLDEGWAPDFVGVVSTKRTVLFSQLNSTVSKPMTPVDFATNRVVNNPFVVKALTGKGVTGVGPFPWKKVLRAGIKVVAMPLYGAERKIVGALLLGWKAKLDEAELRSHAEQVRDKVSVLRLLLGRVKADRNLVGMIANEFPPELFKKHGIKASFFGLLDRNGVLVARGDGSTLNMGQKLAPKSLAIQTARAQLEVTTEVWLKESLLDVQSDKKGKDHGVRPEILRVGFGPIKAKNGKLAGVLLVAWELGDVQTARLKELAGLDVVFLHGKTLSSTTLKSASGSALAAVPTSDQAPGQHKRPEVKRISFAGGAYYGAGATIPMGGSKTFRFVVLGSVHAAQAPFAYGQTLILILGLVLALLILATNVLLRRSFILPLSELERGVADIVAGNMEYTFGVPSRETEGLAYSLNVLMAQLLGRPEPGEEDEEEGGEGSGGPQITFSLGPLPDRAYRPGDSQLIPRLDEDRATYMQRIFGEYVQAMQSIGEDTTGFEISTFQKKLEVNERMICTRLKCSEVRFSVVTGEEEIVLQPYPVA